jgi:hypothetical protein
MSADNKSDIHDCAKIEGWILEEALKFVSNPDPDPHFAVLLMEAYVDIYRSSGVEESLDEEDREGHNLVRHIFMGEICKMVSNPDYEPVAARELMRQIGVYAT